MPVIGFSDKVNLFPSFEGIFTLKILDRNGGIIHERKDNNLIVHTSKPILATLLGGDGIPISQIGLGEGLAAPTTSDTELTNPEYLPFVSVDYPELSVVQFNWYLAYNELIGKEISEFGLFTDDYQMFSRRVYAPIPKNSDMAFEGSWVIRFYTA